MYVSILGLMCATLAALFIYSKRRIIQPATLILVPWVIVAVAYAVSNEAYPLQKRAFVIVAAGILSILVGILIAQIVNGGALVDRDSVRYRGSHGRLEIVYSDRLFFRYYVIACAALFVYYCLQLYNLWPALKAVGGVGTVFRGGAGQEFRRTYLETRIGQLGEGLSTGTLAVSIIGYFLFLGSVALIMAGYYASVGRYALASIPLVMAAAFSLVILERATFMYGAAMFIVSWGYHYRLCSRRKRVTVGRGLAAGAAVSLVAWMVAAIPAALRGSGLGSGDYQAGVVSYVTSGISGLSALSQIDPSLSSAATGAGMRFSPAAIGTAIPGSGHGAWTLQGLFTILNRLGFEFGAASTGMAYVQTGESSSTIANVYTFVVYPYLDGGLPFVMAFGVTIGLISGLVDSAIVAKANSGSIVLISVIGATFIMSFFGLALIRDSRYLFLAIVGYIILSRIGSSRISTEPLAAAGSSRFVGSSVKGRP